MTLPDRLREAAHWHPHLGPLLIDAAQLIEAQQRELRRVAAGKPLPITDEFIDRLVTTIEHYDDTHPTEGQ